MPIPDLQHLIDDAISRFGLDASKKLSATAVFGEPEEQLRAPLEVLLEDVAVALGRKSAKLAIVGETRLAELKTRPDFAVTYNDLLIGFVEVKSPGHGADPRKFKDAHDREQWGKLSALPNLIYTDGNSFSLWGDGGPRSAIVNLPGDVQDPKNPLQASPGLTAVFQGFFGWEPIAPRSPRQLAEVSARLCRLLRDEVSEQLEQGPSLRALAEDWRHLLFPEASDSQFADGYAQAVTFGLLVARARGIPLSDLDAVSKKLGARHSLIGGALRVMVESTSNEAVLTTSVATLTRVLDVVDWSKLSGGNVEAWLYFYQDFLATYDNSLRKATGSYYTPPEVVASMTRLVDEVLQSRFAKSAGLADDKVTVLDPAVGTGTFLLEILRRMAETVELDLGQGAVPAFIADALNRVMGFEIQLGPYAVAQLRMLAELVDLGVPDPPTDGLRLFVTNTLDNPFVQEEHLGQLYEPIARSRREANRIKKDVPIVVVVGNPPYKEKSHGTGGWVEHGHPQAGQEPILRDFMPPPEWKVGAHVKHLYNPYVYFWRWATWKVFDQDPLNNQGIVCFITVSGFVNGPGFGQMRSYLRRRATELWVVDCSPEGHQPPVQTRVFQGVQQPVCIMIASRTANDDETPAQVRYRSLAVGPREGKFEELSGIGLDDGWEDCPSEWAAPFLPVMTSKWASYPSLDDLLRYSGSGTMPGRTWVIAPDPETLKSRWAALIAAPKLKQSELLQEHPTDRRMDSVQSEGLPGYPTPAGPLESEKGSCLEPVRYGFRSFDRQWIIPDKRLINRPNPTLWTVRGPRQVFLTALRQDDPVAGPAVTFTELIPDLHHYKGSFGGRAYPMFLDPDGLVPNVVPGILESLAATYGSPISAEDLFAYLAAITAHPAYTTTFKEDLERPGIRVPLTTSESAFQTAVDLGRRVLWLFTYGERFSDSASGRPSQRPRMTADQPSVVEPIPSDPNFMPDTLSYDSDARRMFLGVGTIANVSPAMWEYEVGGVNVLTKWFSYRRKNRERPIMGDRRVSPLLDMNSDHWLPAYTKDLIDLLNVLGLLIELEPQQAHLLTQVVEGKLLSVSDLTDAGVLPVDPAVRKSTFKAPKKQAAIQHTFDV